MRENDVFKQGYHFLLLKLRMVDFLKGDVCFLEPVNILFEW